MDVALEEGRAEVLRWREMIHDSVYDVFIQN